MNNLNQNAAWYCPEPKDAAGQIRGYVAFWKGVTFEHRALGEEILRDRTLFVPIQDVDHADLLELLRR